MSTFQHRTRWSVRQARIDIPWPSSSILIRTPSSLVCQLAQVRIGQQNMLRLPAPISCARGSNQPILAKRPERPINQIWPRVIETDQRRAVEDEYSLFHWPHSIVHDGIQNSLPAGPSKTQLMRFLLIPYKIVHPDPLFAMNDRYAPMKRHHRCKPLNDRPPVRLGTKSVALAGYGPLPIYPGEQTLLSGENKKADQLRPCFAVDQPNSSK